jgi:hypothetical protein
MECPRCGGLMVEEPFIDMLDTNVDFLGSRCLICGEIVDAGIRENRRRMRRERCRVPETNRPVPA